MIVKGFPTIVLCPFQVKYDEILWGLSVGAWLNPVKVGRQSMIFMKGTCFCNEIHCEPVFFGKYFCRRMWEINFLPCGVPTDECWFGTMNFAPECVRGYCIQTSGTPKKHVFFVPSGCFIASNMYHLWTLNIMCFFFIHLVLGINIRPIWSFKHPPSHFGVHPVHEITKRWTEHGKNDVGRPQIQLWNVLDLAPYRSVVSGVIYTGMSMELSK